MKIFTNRYYTVGGAAKRGKVAEHELRKLIELDIIKIRKPFGAPMIYGSEVVKIKKEWEKFERVTKEEGEVK